MSATIPAYATVPEWCRLSGIGRTITYEAISAGHIKARKVGTRTLIDVKHGLAWIDSQPPAMIRPHGRATRQQAAA